MSRACARVSTKWITFWQRPMVVPFTLFTLN